LVKKTHFYGVHFQLLVCPKHSVQEVNTAKD
jgi:hypothetical protein